MRLFWMEMRKLLTKLRIQDIADIVSDIKGTADSFMKHLSLNRQPHKVVVIILARFQAIKKIFYISPKQYQHLIFENHHYLT